MTDTYIYEFLFRGNPKTAADDDTYHVILRRDFVDLQGEPAFEMTQALPPSRAAELGFPLSAILSTINESAIMQAERVTAAETRLANLMREYEELEVQSQRITEAAEVEINEARSAIMSENQALREEAASARAEQNVMRVRFIDIVGRTETAVTSMRDRMNEALAVAEVATADAEKARMELSSMQASMQAEIGAAKDEAAAREATATQRIREAEQKITSANDAILSERDMREKMNLLEQRLREAEAEVTEITASADRELSEANMRIIASDAQAKNATALAEAAIRNAEREAARIVREQENIAAREADVMRRRQEADELSAAAQVVSVEAARSVAAAQAKARETAAIAADDAATLVKLSPEGRERYMARLLAAGGPT